MPILIFPLVLSAATQLLDIVARRSKLYPAEGPSLVGAVRDVVQAVSIAAEETPEQTAERLHAHDATVASFAAGPPPGARLEGVTP